MTNSDRKEDECITAIILSEEYEQDYDTVLDVLSSLSDSEMAGVVEHIMNNDLEDLL